MPIGTQMNTIDKRVIFGIGAGGTFAATGSAIAAAASGANGFRIVFGVKIMCEGSLRCP
jgi:hypothetical protein